MQSTITMVNKDIPGRSQSVKDMQFLVRFDGDGLFACCWGDSKCVSVNFRDKATLRSMVSFYNIEMFH